MATVTKRGKSLRLVLNDALHGAAYIPFDQEEWCSLLARRAKHYATMQEQACSFEWACGPKWEAKEKRCEDSIREVARRIDGVLDVVFSGDPRGYVVKLRLANGRCNTWGNDGLWGIE